jgi:ubiquinone/menaquinone biosynthesis C-methylase UbiE
MKKPELSNQEFIKNQYTTSEKINCRIDLHTAYSENKYGWHPWVFDQLALCEGVKLLELGCGPGTLWGKNQNRIPQKSEILLSDLSFGILQSAREALQGDFGYLVVNAEEIPLCSGHWDVVVANHMLYHVPDKRKAVSEIKRVLARGGKLCASTVGQAHLKEITELVNRFNSQWVWWNASNSFLLEDGQQFLEQWFPHVERRRYEDALVIPNPDELIAYIFSGTNDEMEPQREPFQKFIHQEFEKRGGVFRITKDSGLFIAY